MRPRILTLASAASLCVICGASVAQTTKPETNPCAANPAASPDDKSLSEQLNDCNGVLAPPKVGDGEIVEPAPPGGTIIVIPPSDVPQQQSGRGRSDAPASSQIENSAYDIADLVEAISRSAQTAKDLETVEPKHVDVRDISILLGGSNSAVLNASMAENAAAIDKLRKSITGNDALASAVLSNGLTIVGIVAAMIDDQKKVTLFGR